MGINEQGLIKEESPRVISRIQEESLTYSFRQNPTRDHSRLDVLEQLKDNIQQLENLNGRLGFLLKEVQGILKKS